MDSGRGMSFCACDAALHVYLSTYVRAKRLCAPLIACLIIVFCRDPCTLPNRFMTFPLFYFMFCYVKISVTKKQMFPNAALALRIFVSLNCVIFILIFKIIINIKQNSNSKNLAAKMIIL